MITKYININTESQVSQIEFEALYTDGKITVVGTEIKEEVSNYDGEKYESAIVDNSNELESEQQNKPCQLINKVEYVYFRESYPQEIEVFVADKKLMQEMKSPDFEARQERLHAKKAELTALSQDIVQHVAGVDVGNIEHIKSCFVALHAEVRQLEGKAPKGTVARHSHTNNSNANDTSSHNTSNESYNPSPSSTEKK